MNTPFHVILAFSACVGYLIGGIDGAVIGLTIPLCISLMIYLWDIWNDR